MNQPPSLLPNAARDARVAFIKATWHDDIVDRCHEAFIDELSHHGMPADRVDTVTVPGAFEIPLQAKLLAESGRYAAIVAAAFVVDGGIYRHDFVAQAVIEGMMSVQLETRVPILSAVLTPHHFHEHETHLAFFREHFVTKGREVAQASMVTLENVMQAEALRKPD